MGEINQSNSGKTMKRIPLGGGKYAIVDDEDYPVLKRFDWFVSSQGQATTTVRAEELQIEMTRFLMKPVYCQVVVHKNRNKLDNRKSNLVNVSRRVMNCWRGRNKRKKTSIYKGVYFSKEKKKFRTMIQKNGLVYWLGYYKNEKDAARAYNKKAREINGELAYQNKL